MNNYQLIKKLVLTFLCLSSCIINAESQWKVVPLNTQIGLKSVSFIDQFGWIVEDAAGFPDQEPSFFITTDSGKTWKKNTTLPSKNLSLVKFINNQVGWAFGEKLWSTVDGGQTWIQLNANIPVTKIFEVDFIDENKGWFVTGAPEGASSYTTVDGGENWFEQKLPGGFFTAGIKFYNADSGWIIPWGGDKNGGLFHTLNGGDTWSRHGTGGIYYMTGIDLFSDLEGWAVGYAFTDCAAGMKYTSHIYHSLDAGRTITNISQFCSENSPSNIDFVDKQHGWLVDGARILSTKDGGSTWLEEYRLPSSNDYIKSLYMVSSDKGWAVSKGGVLFNYSDSSILASCNQVNVATATDELFSGSEDLEVHIPSLKYDSPLGMQNIQANLVFHSKDTDGKTLWHLLSYSELKAPCVNENTGTVSGDLAIHVPLFQNKFPSAVENTEANFTFNGRDENNNLVWKWTNLSII